jgi:peptidoglycan/LPS O-acetylase OafA/YrhL
MLDTHPRAAFAYGWSLQGLGIALVIDSVLRHPTQRFAALLAWVPMVTLGRMSYALYLWQQLFLDRESTAALCSFPLNLLSVAACATLSYHAIDQTSLAMRQQLERRLFRAPPKPLPLATVAEAQP